MINYRILSFLTFVCLFLSTFQSYSQLPITVPKNANGLEIIKDKQLFLNTVSKDPDKAMVSLKTSIPFLVIDLRYASSNNFMHRKMYPAKTSDTYLRLPAAKALLEVQKELNEKGYGLKIYDAYRPYSVTVKFWELVHDERYVANPKKASGHNRGIAVDLAVIDLQTGQELNMGTSFDNFTDSAHHDFINLPKQILNNRQLLKEVMEKHGFLKFDTEWWHYSWPHPEKFEVLDLDIAKGKEYFKSRLEN